MERGVSACTHVGNEGGSPSILVCGRVERRQGKDGDHILRLYARQRKKKRLLNKWGGNGNGGPPGRCDREASVCETIKNKEKITTFQPYIWLVPPPSLLGSGSINRSLRSVGGVDGPCIMTWWVDRRHARRPQPPTPTDRAGGLKSSNFKRLRSIDVWIGAGGGS